MRVYRNCLEYGFHDIEQGSDGRNHGRDKSRYVGDDNYEAQRQKAVVGPAIGAAIAQRESVKILFQPPLPQ